MIGMNDNFVDRDDELIDLDNGLVIPDEIVDVVLIGFDEVEMFGGHLNLTFGIGSD